MATIVNAKFKQKRGTEESMPTLLEGEFYVCTDSYKLYVGSASGNKLICDISQLNENTQEINNLKTLENWNSAVLENGWLDNNNVGFKYFKHNGIIHIYARVTSGSVENGTKVTTLPTGYRPSNVILFPLTNTTTGVNNLLVIEPDGVVLIHSSARFTSGALLLGEISYRGEH